MLRKVIAPLILALPLAISTAPLKAQTTIVDTGPGGPIIGGTSFGSFQWVAAEFSITDPYSVTDVHAWIGSVTGGTATAALYTDSGGIPGTELFSSAFTVAAGVNDWYGQSGLDWGVTAGTYWVAFEVRPENSLPHGVFPAFFPEPLDTYAINFGSGYLLEEDAAFGVRVLGTVAAIPEPETYAMLLAGLAVLGFASRRRKRTTAAA